jgi:hypothetical protein
MEGFKFCVSGGGGGGGAGQEMEEIPFTNLPGTGIQFTVEVMGKG